MITLEIENEISKDKMKMVVDVLKALGVKAKFNDEEFKTKFTKQEFTNKIEKALKGQKTRVSRKEQRKILGVDELEKT